MAGGRASATSRQAADHFLDDECEQRFSDRGERYVLGQCARPTGEFKARELLEQVSPLAEEAKVRVYDGGKCWFAEVKKNRDRLKPKQVKAFRRIEKLYRIPVQLVRVHAG